MLSLILGVLAFVLFFVYDINSIRWRSTFLHSFFAVGILLLGLGTVLDFIRAIDMGAISGAVDWALLVLGGIGFAAVIYCLFFALPFNETYNTESGSGCVCDRGVYALCRHPGVWPFFAMYLFWGLSALPGGMLLNGMVFSALNFIYVWFQDRVIFPTSFCDYDKYRQEVPFLLPTNASVRRAYKTLFRTVKEEGDL